MPIPRRDNTAGRVYNDLRNLARRTGRGTDELLLTYVLERFLYRLSLSKPQRFVLKGGLLLALFDARRATRDIDLLGQATDNDPIAVKATVASFASEDVDDGVVYDLGAVKAATIREDADYAGVRVTLPAHVGQARLKLSVDVNFGDPVTPSPQQVSFPQLLHSEPFELLGYPLETVIAEKLSTAITLGDANTRDRDYADLYRLVANHDLDGNTAKEALIKTAVFRGSMIRPLSEAVRTLPARRQNSYTAWLRKQGNNAAHYPKDFAALVAVVAAFADPLAGSSFDDYSWHASTLSWQPKIGRSGR